MKKIYQTPVTDLVKIGITQMLMGSVVEQGFKPENAPDTEEISGNLARRKDIWADEDEEEDY